MIKKYFSTYFVLFVFKYALSMYFYRNQKTTVDNFMDIIY
jgi:hypothetical protein